MGFIMANMALESGRGSLPMHAHHRPHLEGHGVDHLRPHGAHQIGKALRRHQVDELLEDGPLRQGVRRGVGDVVDAQGLGAEPGQVVAPACRSSCGRR